MPLTSGSCGTVTATPASGTLFPVGNTTVNVSTSSGQTCSFTITVNDVESPAITSCPTVAPFCKNTSGNYSIPLLTATDNCPGDIDISYSISGATTRSGTGNDASGAFNEGTSTISWKAVDANGLYTTSCQTTVTVSPAIHVSIPDAFAASSGVSPNTVYVGYTPAAAITLTADVSGGTPPYTYSWSDGSDASSITVTPTVTAVYTVSVTGADGCTGTASKTISVVDIRGGKKLDKVIICHYPGVNANTLTIDAAGVADHLRHGDMLGSCVPEPALITGRMGNDRGVVSPPVTARVYPNPAAKYFNVLIEGAGTEPVQLRVVDIYGRLMERKHHLPLNQTSTFGYRYKPGTYILEIIQGKVRKQQKLIKVSE
jgi:hypothetical protein